MKRTWTLKLSFAVVLLALMLAVSCGPKEDVVTDPSDDTMTEDVVEDTMEDDAADDVTDSDIDSDTMNDDAMAADAGMEDTGSEMGGMSDMTRDEFEGEHVYFDYDSSTIMEAYTAIIEAKADWLKSNADATVEIQGHCDERGTTEYNLALGDRRAARIKAFLENLGIEASRIVTVSYGEESPIEDGHSESAWQRNRRAQFIIK